MTPFFPNQREQILRERMLEISRLIPDHPVKLKYNTILGELLYSLMELEAN
jgi:hypothetical protein